MTVVTGFAAQSLTPASRSAVAEAWGDVIDVRAAINDDYDNSYRDSGGFTPDRRENRSRGEDWPIFRTEHDLANIRAIGDYFGKRSPGGIGPLDTLANYTFGRGFEASAQPAEGLAEGAVSEEFLAAVNAVIDEAAEDFDAIRCREWDKRSRRHGESVLVLEPAPGGRSRVRFAEPSQLTEPTTSKRGIEDWLTGAGIVDCMSFATEWSFGVLTQQNRHDRAFGYHFCWNPTGDDWDFVTESRVVHVRRNVDESVKRGVSDFYGGCWEFLGYSEKLLRNTAVGAAIQAAIAYIEQFAAGTSKDAVQRQVSGTATGVSRIPSTGGLGTTNDRQVYNRRFLPGTVLKVSEGREYVAPPLGSDRIPNFVEIIQACFRYQGLRWNMPEYMISGDASNANFASTLVAESPFVKAREADQAFYAGHYRDLLWKRLRLSFEAGRFARFVNTWGELRSVVFVKVDPPRVATRDEFKAAQTDEILCRLGAKSVRTVATDNGLDYEAEVDAGAAPQLPALPAASGQAFGGVGVSAQPNSQNPGQSLPPQAGSGGSPAGSMGQPNQQPATDNPATRAAIESVDVALRTIASKFAKYP